MLNHIGTFRTLASGIMLFWALYFSLITLTNALDALKSIGLLPPGWVFASGNYGLMAKTTAAFGAPAVIVALLFLGVIVWEALAAVLFWRAWATRVRRVIWAAFTVGLALWAVFALVDEILIAYALGPVHLRLFGVQLLSLIAIRLLPDD